MLSSPRVSLLASSDASKKNNPQCGDRQDSYIMGYGIKLICNYLTKLFPQF